jgi:hypothetical protein
MSGMVNEALVRYHTTFEADARIPGAVRRAVDYLWARDWDAGAGAFRYLGGWCNGDGPTPAADLNNMPSPGSASWRGRPATAATSPGATRCSPAP